MFPKSLIKCAIKIYFYMRIIFITKEKNLKINFNYYMTDLARNNYYLQDFQKMNIKLNREYIKNNKTYYFNEQNIVIDRDLKESQNFFESSIGYIQENLLDGLPGIYLISCKPIILNNNSNCNPSTIYYCSNVNGEDQNKHKLSYKIQLKLIKDKSSTIKRLRLKRDLLLNKNLYDDESTGEIIRRVSDRLKNKR